MSASVSSSSLWLTPDVPNGGRSLGADVSPTGIKPDGGKAQVGLQNQARMWPTPAASEARLGFQDRSDPSKVGTQESLSTKAMLWSTPRASDGEKGGPNQSFGAGGEPLPSQAVHMAAYLDRNIWPTPTAMNRPRSDETIGKCLSSRKAKAGQNTVPLYLEDVASRLSLQALGTETDGAPSSPERRSLNPLFVEWLMGWPPGWTLLVSTDFGCSETALSRFRLDMRSALSQLALHDAPPAQASLFG